MADPAVTASVAQSLVNELPANIGAALALVPTLEWAKRTSTPALAWINIHTAPYISVIFAAAAAAGIHGSFDSHGGVLTITGLTAVGISQGLLELGKQWLGQHWTYKLYQGFDSLKTVAVAINKILAVPTPSIPTANVGTGDGKVLTP